jgi:hypothetical protein
MNVLNLSQGLPGLQGKRVKFKVQGDVRRKERTGFGPFQRERWETTEFDMVLEPGERMAASDGLSFEVEEGPDGWIITGTISKTSCVFGQFLYNDPKTWFNFTMLSISPYEVRGRIERFEGTSGKQSDGKFAA